MRYLMILVCLLCVAASDQGRQKPQDPTSRRPRPPKGAESRPLRPVQEPIRTRVERKDLLQRFKGESPLEGMYQLIAVQGHAQRVAGRGAGYLVIGRDHLSIQIHGPGTKDSIPLIQSGFRRYRLQGDKIFMTNLLGHRNKENGDMLVDKVGLREVRRYVRAGSKLRIYRTDNEYMEFKRIE